MLGEDEIRNKAKEELGKENTDSIAIGSASKDALIKIYFDADDVEGAKKKIDNARIIKEYAKANLSITNI